MLERNFGVKVDRFGRWVCERCNQRAEPLLILETRILCASCLVELRPEIAKRLNDELQYELSRGNIQDESHPSTKW